MSRFILAGIARFKFYHTTGQKITIYLFYLKKRFAKSFYSKTPLLKTDASRFVSVSTEGF